jgi:hypothetical protein
MIHEKCPVCGLIFATKNQDPSVPVLSLRDPAHEVCSTACELIRSKRIAKRAARKMRLDERDKQQLERDSKRLKHLIPD